MNKPKQPILRIASIVLLVLVALGIGLALGAQRPLPLRVVTDFPMRTLADEAYTMNECLECHEAGEYHTCTTCHDEHGAVELADLPFFATLALLGDVPDPGYVFLNDLLPYRDHPNTHRTLRSFLQEHGVEDYISVTLVSGDGGFVTITPDQLTDQALLLPYTDGIRFASEDLHASAWLKAINRIIIVGPETPLMLDGEATSIGRLLLGPIQEVTVEATQVMLKSELDGVVRSASVAARIHGAPLQLHLSQPEFRLLRVTDQQGGTVELTAEEAENALLANVRDEVTLVLPARGRSLWIRNVAEIRTLGW